MPSSPRPSATRPRGGGHPLQRGPQDRHPRLRPGCGDHLTLPDGSGLELLEELRAAGSTTHIIILSGATTESDRVHALDLGADDYVVKPFFVRELVARVLAVRRRSDLDEDLELHVGHLDIDLRARTVTTGGSPIELTAKEFDLLVYLAARPGHVFSRGDLLQAVWHSAVEWQHAATVTEHVRRVRAKIERPSQPPLIHTVRGAGYRLDVSEVSRTG